MASAPRAPLSLHHPCQFAQAGTQAVAATARAVAPLANTVLDATTGIPAMIKEGRLGRVPVMTAPRRVVGAGYVRPDGS